MAGEPTSSRNRKIITASLRLCLGGKFCLNKFSAILTASQNASVPLADDGSVLAGVDFDIYTFADLAPIASVSRFARLPARHAILDIIGCLLANRCQVKKLLF